MKRVPQALAFLALLMLWVAIPLGAQQLSPPRDTDNTEDAEDALEDAYEEEDDESERMAYFQAALTSAQAEIAENPENPLGYRLGAFAAVGLEQYAVAGEYFDRAAELYPLYEVEDGGTRQQIWVDLYQQASPLIETGDYEGAAVVFEDAHAIYKGRPEVMITLAQIYGALNEFDRTLEYVDEARAFMASDAVTVMDSATVASWEEQAAVLPLLRAQVLTADNRYAEAVEAYEELRELEPANVSYALDLAAIQMTLGNETRALAIYEELFSMPGVSGADYYAMGVGFYNGDDFENAARGFSAAAEQSPRDRDALEMWARSLQLDSLFAEVPAIAQRWTELDPNSQSGWAIMAQAANVTGDSETTQQAMTAIQALEVSVDQLALQRLGSGGGIVAGLIINKTLDVGTSVTMQFTFYGTAGNEIGSLSETISAGAVDEALSFEVQFDSPEAVGGYSYELSVG